MNKKSLKIVQNEIDKRTIKVHSVFNETGNEPRHKGESRMNAQRKENIARAIIANRSTAQLCEGE